MPLTAEQQTTLRGALEALGAELRSLLDASREGAGPVDLDEPIGRLSRMDALQQQSMVQASRGAAMRRIQQVEAALRRLEQGEYGDCQECGEEVGYARLEVRPEAPLCMTCQSLREGRK